MCLITYSCVDVSTFPSRQCFSAAVVQAWQSFGVEVVQWVTCIEGHRNTESKSLKLSSRNYLPVAFVLQNLFWKTLLEIRVIDINAM